MNVMDVTEIKKFLAHRYPFLLVDRVTDYESGKWLRGIKNVSVNEPYFNGHFPDKPIMPGVLQIEALAQTTGLLGFVTMDGQKEDDTLYILVGVDKVKFRRQVVPGDQVELYAELKKKRGNIWMFNTEAKVDGEITTTAEIMCAEVKGGK